MYETNEFEPTLASDCVGALACLSAALLPLEVIPIALDTVAQVAKKGISWKAKKAVLEFLQVRNFSVKAFMF